jgi:hypothetical protein
MCVVCFFNYFFFKLVNLNKPSCLKLHCSKVKKLKKKQIHDLKKLCALFFPNNIATI